jgi:hypothetical protein
LRKKDKIHDVRRNERLRTKPSISYKNRDLEINNNYNIQVGILKWEKAIKDKLNSLIKKKTWTLVQKSKNVNTINSKWGFTSTIKHDENGNLTKYKARLVARGFNQLKS